MDTPDFTFVFDDIVDGSSTVTFTKTGQVTPAHFVISIDDAPICLLNGRHLSPIEADLLDLAVAIHFADKLALPKKKRSIKVHINLPLRHPEIFRQVHQELCDLLFWYTNDFWCFHFYYRKANGRKIEHSPPGYLGLSDVTESVEFALWSGGLDSLAGLQTRLLKRQRQDDQFTLIGTGSNSIMHKTQQRVFQTLHLSPHASGRLHLFNIPISAEYGERYTKNSSHRTRGLVFLLIGAVCTLVNGSNKLYVYENGIGALNLPLPGGVGRDHSKAVHPISLIDLGDFVSRVAGKEFSIENPFIFSTKAEMCRSLKDNLISVFETISCDRLHRKKYIQCGSCSSCILRRQALAAAGIEDKTRYWIPHGRKPELRHYAYWEKMNQQVEVIEQAVNSSDAWYKLRLEYPNDLPEAIDRITEQAGCDEHGMSERVIRLYRTYVREWRSVAQTIFDDIDYDTGNSSDLEEKRWQKMRLIK